MVEAIKQMNVHDRWKYGYLAVTDEAFKYLALQRGSLDKFKGNRRMWEAEYYKGLSKSYEGMRQHLPKTAERILDVGSGLGGIDIFLSRHYGGMVGGSVKEMGPQLYLLDGANDPAKMHLHAKTFSNESAAKRFHADNGSHHVEYLGVGDQRNWPIVPYDLIISTGAWCFHFEPKMYLEYVLKCMHGGTVLITDVRNDKPEWLAQLLQVLDCKDIIATEAKRTRRVFTLPALDPAP